MKQGLYSPTEIKTIRQNWLITQTEFAKIIGKSQPHIVSIEKGRFAVTQNLCDKIQEIQDEINEEIIKLDKKYWEAKEFWIIVYEDKIIDKIAKKKYYLNCLKRRAKTAHLVTWNEEEYDKWLKGKKDCEHNKAVWARLTYQTSGEMHPDESQAKYNCPWVG